MTWTAGDMEALRRKHLTYLIFRADRDGVIQAAEGPAFAHVGLDPQSLEFGTTTIAAVFAPVDPHAALSTATERARSGDEVNFGLRWRGEYFHATLAPVLDGNGEVVGIDGIFSLNQPATARDEEPLLPLVNHMAGMAYRCQNDEAWTMDIVSDGCLPVTGYSADELRNNAKVAFGDLVHEEDAGWLWDKCQVNLDAGRFCSNQYRIRHATGEIRWVWDRAQGVYADDGTLLYIEGLVTDITAQKRTEEAREKLHKQLLESQRVQVLGQLSGGIAHDFNNLLHVIGASLEMVQIADEDPEQLLEDARAAVRRAGDLTHQLLTFSRRSTSEPSVVDMNEFVAGEVEFLGRTLPSTIKLRFTPSESPAHAKVERTQMRQVLSNLCLNARDAMPEGGEITISLQTVGGEADGDELPLCCLDVADTGLGMPPDVRERVLEPFFTTKPVGEGTGLGLAITHSIVSQHGGRLSLDSELGAGTRIRVQIPSVDPAT